MKITIEVGNKEIADFVLKLQGQLGSKNPNAAEIAKEVLKELTKRMTKPCGNSVV